MDASREAVYALLGRACSRRAPSLSPRLPCTQSGQPTNPPGRTLEEEEVRRRACSSAPAARRQGSVRRRRARLQPKRMDLRCRCSWPCRSMTSSTCLISPSSAPRWPPRSASWCLTPGAFSAGLLACKRRRVAAAVTDLRSQSDADARRPGPAVLAHGLNHHPPPLLAACRPMLGAAAAPAVALQAPAGRHLIHEVDAESEASRCEKASLLKLVNGCRACRSNPMRPAAGGGHPHPPRSTPHPALPPTSEGCAANELMHSVESVRPLYVAHREQGAEETALDLLATTITNVVRFALCTAQYSRHSVVSDGRGGRTEWAPDPQRPPTRRLPHRPACFPPPAAAERRAGDGCHPVAPAGRPRLCRVCAHRAAGRGAGLPAGRVPPAAGGRGRGGRGLRCAQLG